MSKKIIIFVITLVILLILIFAYNYFNFPKTKDSGIDNLNSSKPESFPSSIGFRGPTGNPYTKGPTGPPPGR